MTAMKTAEEVRAHCESVGYDTHEAYSATCLHFTTIKIVSLAIVVAACIIKIP